NPMKPKRTMKTEVASWIILLLFLLMAVFWCSPMAAGNQEINSPESQSKKRDIIVLPILYYKPETKIALGVGGLYYLKTAAQGAYTRPSNIFIAAVATQRKQFYIELKPDVYWNDDKYHLVGNFRVNKYVDKYFGIGSMATSDDEETYSYRNLEIKLDFLRKFRSELSLGLQYALETYKITEYDSEGELINKKVSGSESGTASGLGFIINWDSRDNIFSPGKGSFHQITATLYDGIFGSDFEYLSLIYDARKYVSLLPSHTLAFQIYSEFRTGNPSFRRLSLLGGEERMRGFYQGRYRDKNLLVFQVEYRIIPVVWRIGVAGFMAVGDVADRLGGFDFGSFKYAGGFGIRYLWNREDKLNLRIDIAWGQDTSGFYITIKEAF
ncbi:MAG: BamA/TamA family outer membrane protein, partial [Candidatus Aminicenantes bacterium]|nr:BamA/TamA family outer membrane protein [Candidatus Aminicenantes bacterium]